MSNIIFVAKQKDIFTVKEVAEYLTISTKSVYKLIESRELETFRIGNRYKITANSISEYMDKKLDHQRTQHEDNKNIVLKQML